MNAADVAAARRVLAARRGELEAAVTAALGSAGPDTGWSIPPERVRDLNAVMDAVDAATNELERQQRHADDERAAAIRERRRDRRQ